MPTQTEIQESITSRIIDGLNAGIVPWKKPWNSDPNCGPATNVVSKRTYSGINPVLLNLSSQLHSFSSRFWGTFDQWKNLGGKVKKRPDNVEPGHWGTNIIFFRQVKKKSVDDAGDEKTESFPLMRSYTVFNLEQVEGEALDHLRPSTEPNTSPPLFGNVERAVEATGAVFNFGGHRAFYTRPIGQFPNHTDGDHIWMPHWYQFDDLHEFYATQYHELVHWSEVRLGWEGEYSMGELIAEIGSTFLCAQTNVPGSDDLKNHTMYLASWLKELQNDRKFIFKAAAQASKAAEFILSFSRPKEAVPELEEIEA